MTQNPTKNLSDEDIKDIALMVDELIVKVGEKYRPEGIQFAAIALGRLMVFTKHVGCFNTFSEMMEEIAKMKEPEPLVKPENVQ